jgi:hypothetical protein
MDAYSRVQTQEKIDEEYDGGSRLDKLRAAAIAAAQKLTCCSALRRAAKAGLIER